jgi:nucleotide-binding universal stress UspA family protein
MTRHVRRILVPVDFGPASAAAFDYAKEIARLFHARLFLLHAIDDPAAAGTWAAPDFYIPTTPAVRESRLREATLRLTNMITPDIAEGFEPTVEVQIGPAIPTVEDYAREQNIDLIVMGTHGRRGLAHMLLGSVAERLVRSAPCPVLTVRESLVLDADASREPEACAVPAR